MYWKMVPNLISPPYNNSPITIDEGVIASGGTMPRYFKGRNTLYINFSNIYPDTIIISDLLTNGTLYSPIGKFVNSIGMFIRELHRSWNTYSG